VVEGEVLGEVRRREQGERGGERGRSHEERTPRGHGRPVAAACGEQRARGGEPPRRDDREHTGEEVRGHVLGEERPGGERTGEDAQAHVVAAHGPHGGEEEGRREDSEVVVRRAAEARVVHEDRREEEEGGPGAAGARLVEEPARHRRDARERDEEEEELQVLRQHPAELRLVERARRDDHRERVHEARKLGHVAGVVAVEGDDAAVPGIVDRDLEVAPGGVVVDRLGRHDPDVDDADPDDAEGEHGPVRDAVDEAPRRGLPGGRHRPRVPVAEERRERPRPGEQHGRRPGDGEPGVELVRVASGVHAEDEDDEAERGAVDQDLERRQVGQAQRARQDEVPGADARGDEQAPPRPERCVGPEQPIADWVGRAEPRRVAACRRDHDDHGHYRAPPVAARIAPALSCRLERHVVSADLGTGGAHHGSIIFCQRSPAQCRVMALPPLQPPRSRGFATSASSPPRPARAACVHASRFD
jgi:hypothetical protein